MVPESDNNNADNTTNRLCTHSEAISGNCSCYNDNDNNNNTNTNTKDSNLCSYAQATGWDNLYDPTVNGQTSSGLQTQNFGDVLPSFEMHHFMLNRSLSQPEYHLIFPPEYEDSMAETSISSLSNFQNQQNDTPEIPSFDSSELLLNNLHKLQRINIPVNVSITLTKEMPEMGKPFEKEYPLKQYYPGEMVYGFATFENTSPFEIPFEILLVSMNCDIGVKNAEINSQTGKRIITSYDLEASYHFDNNGNNSEIQDIDPFDNIYTCFGPRRVLKPHNKVKKFFKFRIPTYLLDDNCDHQFSEHLKIPPSFGINKYSWNSRACAIGINKTLGYGRLEKTGSPLKVNDSALNGEFCSYYISVDIIGKRLDSYKKFYKPETKHQYDYIFLKNVEHYFRVGKSPQDIEERVLNYGSTKSQLDYIENIAKETIEVLTERGMLQEVDVTNIRDQDEIIYSTNGKNKASISMDIERNLEKQGLNVEEFYEKSFTKSIKKDIFFKVNGELRVNCKMKKEARMQSFLPKMMERKESSVLFDVEHMKASSPIVKFELEFKPFEEREIKNTKLPNSIEITPAMKAIDLQSANSIPFLIDNDFIIQDLNDIKQYFEKFKLYYTKIKELLCQTKSKVLKSTYDILKGMANLEYNEIEIPNILKSENINLQGKWIYDSKSKIYKCEFEYKLELNLKDIMINPKALISTFQTCLFARLYKVQLDITTKNMKNDKKNKLTFPITVV